METAYKNKIKKYLPLLTLLKDAKKNKNVDLKSLINRLEPDVIQLLSHCALNFLKNKQVQIRKNSILKRKKRKALKQLACKSVSCFKKRDILLQHGSGILVPLLGAILPFLGNLLFNK